jgi:hypothetical protein
MMIKSMGIGVTPADKMNFEKIQSRGPNVLLSQDGTKVVMTQDNALVRTAVMEDELDEIKAKTEYFAVQLGRDEEQAGNDVGAFQKRIDDAVVNATTAYVKNLHDSVYQKTMTKFKFAAPAKQSAVKEMVVAPQPVAKQKEPSSIDVEKIGFDFKEKFGTGVEPFLEAIKASRYGDYALELAYEINFPERTHSENATLSIIQNADTFQKIQKSNKPQDMEALVQVFEKGEHELYNTFLDPYNFDKTPPTERGYNIAFALTKAALTVWDGNRGLLQLCDFIEPGTFTAMVNHNYGKAWSKDEVGGMKAKVA